MLASLHVDASIPNFLIQECYGQAVPQVRDKVWEEWFGFPAMRMVNGKHPLLEKPGLGSELSEDAPGLRGAARWPGSFTRTGPSRGGKRSTGFHKKTRKPLRVAIFAAVVAASAGAQTSSVSGTRIAVTIDAGARHALQDVIAKWAANAPLAFVDQYVGTLSGAGDKFFYSATGSANSKVCLKLVNTASTSQAINITLNGLGTRTHTAGVNTLQAKRPGQPTPSQGRTASCRCGPRSASRESGWNTFCPYSIPILEIDLKPAR